MEKRGEDEDNKQTSNQLLDEEKTCKNGQKLKWGNRYDLGKKLKWDNTFLFEYLTQVVFKCFFFIFLQPSSIPQEFLHQ